MTRAVHDPSALAATRRVSAMDWSRVADDLERDGCAGTGKLLTAADCRRLKALYEDEGAFRKRVVMEQRGFGQGEYRYLSYPLPSVVQALREAIYPRLAPIANRWREALRQPVSFPPTLAGYLARCHRAGQSRPTPLILKYGPGDYNCLHQDLYGDLVFPLQLTLLLSSPEEDFRGGEFMLVENRPRRQARGRVVALRRGEAVVFPVRERPVLGARGPYRATMRHGVSPLHSGERFTLGIIFHDAA
ncbi:MAG: 2OG-Fe(II) oxygenase [Arenicellales bacterium]